MGFTASALPLPSVPSGWAEAYYGSYLSPLVERIPGYDPTKYKTERGQDLVQYYTGTTGNNTMSGIPYNSGAGRHRSIEYVSLTNAGESILFDTRMRAVGGSAQAQLTYTFYSVFGTDHVSGINDGYQIGIWDDQTIIYEVNGGGFDVIATRPGLFLPAGGAYTNIRIELRPTLGEIEFRNADNDSVYDTILTPNLNSFSANRAWGHRIYRSGFDVDEERMMLVSSGPPPAKHLLSGGSGNVRVYHHQNDQKLRVTAGVELVHTQDLGTGARCIVIRFDGANTKVDIGGLTQLLGDAGAAAALMGRILARSDASEFLNTGRHYQTIAWDRLLTDEEVQDVIDRSWWHYGSAR